MAKFIITKRTNDEFQFTLSNNDGKTLLRSEGYKVAASCMNGVESVKKNSGEDARYELKTANNGKFYFNLKATNGQVIGSSDMFETEAIRSTMVEQVKADAASASIDDTTK